MLRNQQGNRLNNAPTCAFNIWIDLNKTNDWIGNTGQSISLVQNQTPLWKFLQYWLWRIIQLLCLRFSSQRRIYEQIWGISSPFFLELQETFLHHSSAIFLGKGLIYTFLILPCLASWAGVQALLWYFFPSSVKHITSVTSSLTNRDTDMIKKTQRLSHWWAWNYAPTAQNM